MPMRRRPAKRLGPVGARHGATSPPVLRGGGGRSVGLSSVVDRRSLPVALSFPLSCKVPSLLLFRLVVHVPFSVWSLLTQAVSWRCRGFSYSSLLLSVGVALYRPVLFRGCSQAVSWLFLGLFKALSCCCCSSTSARSRFDVVNASRLVELEDRCLR